MGRFCLSSFGQSPLTIQLGTSATGMAEILEWTVSTEREVGATSLPKFYRPSLPATGESTTFSVSNLSGKNTPSQLQVLTKFKTFPSVPNVGPTTLAYPISLTQSFAPGFGIILEPASYLILYARTDYTAEMGVLAAYSDTTGAQSWTANVVWEEF